MATKFQHILLPDDKRVFNLVMLFGTSQSPKSTRSLTAYCAPTVLRTSRFRIAPPQQAARALLHHDYRNDSTASRIRSLYALHHSLSVTIPATQPRLHLSGTNRLRFAPWRSASETDLFPGREKSTRWFATGGICIWLIHLLLVFLPLSALLIYFCPECYYSVLDWIYGDPERVSQRVRIVLWGSALLPSAIVYGYQALRLWLRLRRIRERRFIGVHVPKEVDVASSEGRPGRRLLCGVVASLCLVTGLSTLLTGWSLVCWYHDFEMLRFAQSLRSIPLPPRSQVVATGRRFGLLWGNSNHCDAQVMALVETTWGDTRFSAYFEEPVLLKWPFSGVPDFLEVMKIADQRLYYIFDGKALTVRQDSGLYANSVVAGFSLLERRDFEAAWQLADGHTLSPDKNYYILIASDQIISGYDMLDIRCH
ncbi:MAG: hypothetical protein KZQ96_20690 [Candidatus Thiodiazotropha sp. (ex Lucinoma borealis)]|nr:hypothetical protein [Candidatus Thiodiazotropha sp. (ex Lucinoma borealis)]